MTQRAEQKGHGRLTAWLLEMAVVGALAGVLPVPNTGWAEPDAPIVERATAEQIAITLRGSRDLRGQNVSKGDFSGFDLSGVNFSGADLRQSNFKDANFTAANLDGADLRGAVLANAEMAGAHLGWPT